LCAPHIIETNVFIAKTPKDSLEYFSYYKKLQIFFKNRKSQKFNQSLGNLFLTKYIFLIGFDSSGVFRMDDTWLDEVTFV